MKITRKRIKKKILSVNLLRFISIPMVDMYRICGLWLILCSTVKHQFIHTVQDMHIVVVF